MSDLTISDLTQATLEGSGVFDVLMRANKAHLEAEYAKNRIKGPEYSTVYLGSLDTVMNTALQFLLTKQKINLEAQLLEQQIILAQVEVQKANAQLAQINAQTELVQQQTINAQAELAILQANVLKIPAEIELLNAQTAQTRQQTENLEFQKLQIQAQTDLLDQQERNAVIEGTVLVATECKLRAEYDLILSSVQKSAQEIALLAQKVATEKAQITSMGVDDDSIVGRQKQLYKAQSDGFVRDAEQKAAKIMVDSWNVRRTTDTDITGADDVNKLSDPNIGRVISKLLSGVGA
jgi:hypothetical protein